jgi:glycosyltransferase involved in cell wall biosynthesis
MKVLMVSIPSLHFFRWTEQLKDSGHEVYWFDITGMSHTVEKINWVRQKVNWKLKRNYAGRTFIKNKFPKLYLYIQKYNEYNTAMMFEKYLLEIQPDVVHSFALYVSCTPIISVMENYPNQKWIYSSWGSDLYYFQNVPHYLKDIKRVLPRINYLFTDCKRDYEIAKEYGFNGSFLGVFPGGGGFPLYEMGQYKIATNQRKTILIKGFQGRSGRAIPVLKAIEKLQSKFESFQIIVFGSDSQTIEYCSTSPLRHWTNFELIGKISHKEVLQLMGKAKIYIGNSNSDGIPNTMLEAICMDAFPIQSNPGGATAEIIQHNCNGLLIEDCENVDEIMKNISRSLNMQFDKCIKTLNLKIKSRLSYDCVRKQVVEKYNNI